MLNATNTVNTHINAVSGTLIKSHPKSWFERMHIKNDYCESVFCKRNDHIILQTMLCGDGIIICELVTKKDFEEGQQ